MKILLYQSASDIDAIAMLGLAQVLSQQHHVDVLVPKNQAYLFEGSIDGAILHFEAYPLPQQSSQRGLAVKIDQHFGRAYDTCIHTYVPTHVPRYFEDEYDKDRLTHLYGVMSTVGITLPTRHLVQHNFIYTEADEALIAAFSKSINIAKPIFIFHRSGAQKLSSIRQSGLLLIQQLDLVEQPCDMLDLTQSPNLPLLRTRCHMEC